MTIPKLPVFYDMTYTDLDGRLTADSYLYNDQTFQALNLAVTLLNNLVISSVDATNTITNDGVVFPNKTTAQITALQSAASLGAAWFNTDLAKLQVKTAPGVIETITST